MGRRGPPPTPTAIRVLTGIASHHKAPKGEPQPLPGEPEMPVWLNGMAQREWRRVVPMLLRAGVLTEVDGTALAVYCDAVAMMAEALRIIDEDGPVYSNERTGAVHERPEVGIVKHCRGVLKQFCGEFGMTPSSRSRINIMDGLGGESEMESLLN